MDNGINNTGTKNKDNDEPNTLANEEGLKILQDELPISKGYDAEVLGIDGTDQSGQQEITEEKEAKEPVSKVFTLQKDKEHEPDNSGGGNQPLISKEETFQDKLFKTIQGDSELQEIINNHLLGRDKPRAEEKQQVEFKKLDEYENEDEWLRDNVEKAIEQRLSQRQSEQRQPKYEMPVQERLQARDPQGFKTVMGKMGEYVNRLSVADYNKINNDIGSLYEFYDFIKSNESGGGERGGEIEKDVNRNQPETRRPVPFRVKTSGSNGGQNKQGKKTAWDYSDDEFQAKLNKARVLY